MYNDIDVNTQHAGWGNEQQFSRSAKQNYWLLCGRVRERFPWEQLQHPGDVPAVQPAGPARPPLEQGRALAPAGPTLPSLSGTPFSPFSPRSRTVWCNVPEVLTSCIMLVSASVADP